MSDDFFLPTRLCSKSPGTTSADGILRKLSSSTSTSLSAEAPEFQLRNTAPSYGQINCKFSFLDPSVFNETNCISISSMASKSEVTSVESSSASLPFIEVSLSDNTDLSLSFDNEQILSPLSQGARTTDSPQNSIVSPIHSENFMIPIYNSVDPNSGMLRFSSSQNNLQNLTAMKSNNRPLSPLHAGFDSYQMMSSPNSHQLYPLHHPSSSLHLHQLSQSHNISSNLSRSPYMESLIQHLPDMYQRGHSTSIIRTNETMCHQVMNYRHYQKDHVLESSDGFIYQVQFKRSHRSFALHPSAPRNIHLGDFVRVEADRGEDLGVVLARIPVKDFKETIPTAGYRGRGFFSGHNEIKWLLRTATVIERLLIRDKVQDEEEALGVIREQVALRGLSMNILDVEYQFDRHKLIFYFEADRRIDFRELVSELFSLYKTRIWMQQVDPTVISDGDPGTILAKKSGLLPDRHAHLNLPLVQSYFSSSRKHLSAYKNPWNNSSGASSMTDANTQSADNLSYGYTNIAPYPLHATRETRDPIDWLGPTWNHSMSHFKRTDASLQSWEQEVPSHMNTLTISPEGSPMGKQGVSLDYPLSIQNKEYTNSPTQIITKKTKI